MAVNTLKIKCRLLLVLASVLAATPAQANPPAGGGRFHPREANRQNGPQRQPPQPQQAPQQPPPLNLMNDAPQQFQRRNQGNAGEPQRPRLSPEERRQLRRDIHDAGRDIYPPRR